MQMVGEANSGAMLANAYLTISDPQYVVRNLGFVPYFV